MLVPLLTALQMAAAIPLIHSGRDGQTTVRPPAAAATIVVDGVLDEPMWRNAALLTGFSMYQPVDQRPAPDSTEVLLWYSPSVLYVGVRAFEPHGAVRATLADRDRVASDDNIELLFDTYFERRRAFAFVANALGVQADGTKNEGGGFIPGQNIPPGQNDLSADFVWTSKGRITEWGYEVEMAIPFSSLRYPVRAEQRWGLQVVRHVQHSGYEETWTPAKKGSASFLAQAGVLVGLTGIRHGQIIEVNPEFTSTVNGSPCCDTKAAQWRYENDPRIGGNVRWGVGSNFVLNGTVRPDFSQVEADATQIAQDQRFALFYAEKRPFFVEGSEQFNVPNTLVYTRRIVRPDAAVKLTGKIGRTDVAVLSALDDASTTTAGTRPRVDVVRVQSGFGEQSTAGFVYADRVGAGTDNRLAGGDMRVVLGRIYSFQLQGVGSTSTTADTARSGALWEAVVNRTGRNYGFRYSLLGIQPDFRADVGFVSRTGFVQPSLFNRLTLFGHQGAMLERYTAFFSANTVWRYQDFFAGNSMLESRLSASSQFSFRGGWQLFISPTVGRFRFDPRAYGDLRSTDVAGAALPFALPAPLVTRTLQTMASTPQFRRFAISGAATVGDDIDFLEAARVRRVDYSASLDLRPSERLRVNATWISSAFTRRRDGVRTLAARIPRIRIEYQLARPVFVRVVAQYEATRREALRDPTSGRVLLVRDADGIFAPSAASRSNTLRADALFSYRPSPGTVVFVGYGNSLTESVALALDGLRRTSDGFFVKLSYSFRTGATK